MDKFKKAKLITKVVWQSIMILLGGFLWFAGLSGFRQMTDMKVMGWFVWGILTAPFMIPYVIEMVRDSAKQGKVEGAHTYTASRIGNTVTVSNNPMGGMIKGAVAGLIGSVFMGPIVTPIFTIKRIFDVIKNITILVKTKE